MHLYFLLTYIYKKDLIVKLNLLTQKQVPMIKKITLNIGLPFSILKNKNTFITNLILLEKIVEQQIKCIKARTQNVFLGTKKNAITGLKVDLYKYNLYKFLDFFLFDFLLNLKEKKIFSKKLIKKHQLFLTISNYLTIFILLKIVYLLSNLRPINIVLNLTNQVNQLSSLILFSCLFFPISLAVI